MFNVPIQMNYRVTSDYEETPVLVDVYNIFHLENKGPHALCWFGPSRRWKLVKIEHLTPIQNRTINE